MMISWMQKHRKYLVVTIWISTIAFVGAGFVGWGAYSYNQKKANAVATVGEEQISFKELQSAYSNLYGYYNQMLGGKLTKEKAEELHLQDIALSQLIEQALLLNYAKAHGIIARKEEIVAKIHAIEAFQKNGRFDKKRYFQVLKSIGTDPKSFEHGIRKEVVIEKLEKLLALPATELEAKTLFASAFMEDKIAIKTVDAADLKIDIGDEELKKFWEANKAKYLSKKRYLLEAIEIDATQIEIPEGDLKSYYQEHKTLFKNSEDKILPFEEAKEKVRLKLQKKAAKTEALKKYLAFKKGEIGPEQNLTLVEGESEIPLERIRTAATGTYIKTIASPKGFITAKLIKVEQPAPLPFEKAKALAKADLLAQKRAKLLTKLAEEALKKDDGFKEIGYISRDDIKKLDFMKSNDAARFVNHLFGSQLKEGYLLLEEKAVVYRILDQKLFDSEKFAKQKKRLMESAEALKENTIRQSLIKRLQKTYKIEKHIKG